MGQLIYPSTGEEALDDLEIALSGGSHSKVVRIGQTVRRLSRDRAISVSVFDLLTHIGQAGFSGAPRALGFDDQGREILSFVEGEVAAPLRPGQLGGGDLPHHVWHDDVLVHLGKLIRSYHDAAANFPWEGRTWLLETRQPVETICHNEVFPWNTVFRDGVPVAFIDWDTAAPGPRACDLGLIACVWVPFWPDAVCQLAGLPTGVAEKARRFRLLLDAYGLESGVDVIQAGIERMQGLLDHVRRLVTEGSEWEVEMDRRGAVDELAGNIRWTEEHAAALAGG
ncbi:hypothetical protein HNQ07_003595 [Deinococcus metalli]|uniref:Aminoglycoside phosphotransferase domain-containing protein n=1 Tax=Deinococcus metalli TaxID=1141878 RepID=A0A7W8NPL3_9DEIO|nr:phosphotransferase [Deinococcus metalli]MBB5378094.1 hypothetical protein [Deinococcus metalli]